MSISQRGKRMVDVGTNNGWSSTHTLIIKYHKMLITPSSRLLQGNSMASQPTVNKSLSLPRYPPMPHPCLVLVTLWWCRVTFSLPLLSCSVIIATMTVHPYVTSQRPQAHLRPECQKSRHSLVIELWGKMVLTFTHHSGGNSELILCLWYTLLLESVAHGVLKKPKHQQTENIDLWRCGNRFPKLALKRHKTDPLIGSSNWHAA